MWINLCFLFIETSCFWTCWTESQYQLSNYLINVQNITSRTHSNSTNSQSRFTMSVEVLRQILVNLETSCTRGFLQLLLWCSMGVIKASTQWPFTDHVKRKLWLLWLCWPVKEAVTSVTLLAHWGIIVTHVAGIPLSSKLWVPIPSFVPHTSGPFY